jgi:hypothetical protein
MFSISGFEVLIYFWLKHLGSRASAALTTLHLSMTLPTVCVPGLPQKAKDKMLRTAGFVWGIPRRMASQ